MPSVAAVIIGREILTGKFPDENGPFFIRRLRDLGADLRRLVVVDDDVEAIASEVARCSAAHDHVFTTGGVGPTHDDVTLEAVARAFGVELVLEPRLVELLSKYDIPQDDANLRMARIPAGSELHEGQASGYPIVRTRNVWVLPGVPRLVELKFETIAPLVRGPGIHARRLLLSVHETDIAARLSALVAEHPEVDVGSYPRFGEGDVRVILTLESRSPDALDAADAAISAVLPVKGRIG
ncbi:MAG: competence/damage-inducible protein A [Myxococcales bacterium]|nr:competence/damage-inducible protein A [Myxococcales bacterium]